MRNYQQGPQRNPMQWLFQACLLLLASAVVLNVAVAYLRVVLPWLIGGAVLVAVVWIAAAIVRWRRSRW